MVTTTPISKLFGILHHRLDHTLSTESMPTTYGHIRTALMMFPVMSATWKSSVRASHCKTSSMAACMVSIEGFMSATFSWNSSRSCMASIRIGYLQNKVMYAYYVIYGVLMAFPQSIKEVIHYTHQTYYMLSTHCLSFRSLEKKSSAVPSAFGSPE